MTLSSSFNKFRLAIVLIAVFTFIIEIARYYVFDVPIFYNAKLLFLLILLIVNFLMYAFVDQKYSRLIGIIVLCLGAIAFIDSIQHLMHLIRLGINITEIFRSILSIGLSLVVVGLYTVILFKPKHVFPLDFILAIIILVIGLSHIFSLMYNYALMYRHMDFTTTDMVVLYVSGIFKLFSHPICLLLYLINAHKQHVAEHNKKRSITWD